ncbi:C2 domain-containing protein [Fusarium sp. LHS14.1]|nr:C2 domain-containing protein [Fusarium sp. LHS14.1]
MSDFQGLGAKFEEPDAQGFQSSVTGSTSSPSPFVQASDASSHTSLSLTSNVCLPAPTTHDTTRSQHHMDHLERFVQDLQSSAKRAFPNSAYSRYKEVEVLLIRWEEDELEVEWELNELHKIFRDLYGFSTEQFLIPSHNSHRKLNLKALSFVEEHENEDTLLIVYYGGHGVINKARQSTWSCKQDKTYATVEWSAIQTLFEMAKCDVLLLLDCCAGASAAPLTERPTNIKETIAACGFETWTPRPGAQSFTHSLIEVMKEWASQLPFSAAMLHSEILTRLKHAPPHLSSQGALVESRKTPAYIVSTPDPHTASITLGRMFEEESYSLSSSQAVPGSIPGTLSEKVQSDSYVSSEDRIQALMAVDDKGQRAAPHVLLTVALEEDQVLDAASCARWLKQFPLLAKSVSVEGVYRSYSTLLLLSVPVVLWDLLPDHPATQFVGYVKSRNLVPREVMQDRAATPIPITKHSARDQAVDPFDCVSPLKSTSGLSSLDSGYDSSIPRPATLAALRRTRQTTDGMVGSLASQVLAGNRRNKLSSTELLGPDRPTSVPANTGSGLQQGLVSTSQRPKRLIVSVREADFDNDKLGVTCVLCYGHNVQRSQFVRRATSKPIWNEEFRFEVHNSPMFYHMRLSVWGDQMLELIGELHIDLCELVLKGQLPDLDEWQSLWRDGKKTGSIRIRLQYLDVSEDEERQAAEAKATAAQRQQQRQWLERQHSDDGQARVQQMDFQVW